MGLGPAEAQSLLVWRARCAHRYVSGKPGSGAENAKAIVNVPKITIQRYLIFNLRASENIQILIAPALIRSINNIPTF